MNFWKRAAEVMGLNYRAEQIDGDSGILPPARTNLETFVSTDRAMTVSTVYRAMQILSTSGAQLGLTTQRNGVAIPSDQVPSLVKKPSLEMSRSDFIEQFITSLASAGNSYWHIVRAVDDSIVNLEPWNPHEVYIAKDERTGRRTFRYRGKTYPARDVKHVALMKLPGKEKGLGPIQAAQVELRGALELRDYAALWFSESKIPNAILKTEQALTKTDADDIYEIWEANDRPSGVRVLGKGLDYKPMMLNPSDAQWLESQQFTTTQIARLFGTPASLMLAAVEGSAMTYSNVEQDWIAFVRFTLMGYLRKFEEALSDLIARGQTVRFNIETLLRTDTKTRYEAHGLGLGRWLTVDEIRDIENLPPLTASQREQLAATPTTTPATKADA